ncbi:hypothetical protein MKEN_01231400 [Mycena kentingensis (nom. inval.)]|nr:hypothetical protein MKEN_01231400 [Mycena kentingensis (nom. inval.)]
MADSSQHPPTSMVGPPPAFFDQQEPRWHYPYQQQAPQQQRFEFSYAAPGTPNYDELLQQYYPQYSQAQAQYAPYVPPNAGAGAGTGPPPTPTTAKPAQATKRKRVAKQQQQQQQAAQGGYSDSDSEDGWNPNGGSISVGMGALGMRSKGARLPGACTHCKKLKMKCTVLVGFPRLSVDLPSLPGDFPVDADGEMDNTCRRCRSGGHVCIVEGRKPRSAPNKREYLLAQIRQKDAIIESLLKQLHNPYIATPLSIASYRMATSPSDTSNRNIIDWLDRLQASVRSQAGQSLEGMNSTATFAALARDSSATLQNTANPEMEASSDAESSNHPEEVEDEPDGDSVSLPDASVPIGLLANLSLSSDKRKKRGTKAQAPDKAKEDEDDLDDDNVGVANAAYFRPGPSTDLSMRAQLIEQHSPPEILIHGLVVPEDVDRLFEIFYTRLNPFTALLDPVLHTPASTFARCPFLFTVICAISSRYYPEKSEIYPIAMHFAKHSASTALVDGWKSVELCQAYILMSLFAVPARKWEEDRSWLYAGLAIRLATDLNLHQVAAAKPPKAGAPVNERAELERLNRARVWQICFIVDRSTATQFGKPATIKDNYILRYGGDDWYKKSPFNSPYDVHICGYASLLRLISSFHDDIFSDPVSPTGLNKNADFLAITMRHAAKLDQFTEEWRNRFDRDSDPNNGQCALRTMLMPFTVAYSRLVMFSFGFQQAYRRGLQAHDHIFFTECLESAKSVVRCMVEDLAPHGFMRYAPDAHFTFTAFASAFLMKLLKPEFAHLMSQEEEKRVFNLIGRLIQTLSSPEVAIDDRHTPKLYARFLAGLLSKHRRDGASVGRMQAHSPPSHQSATVPPSADYGQPSSTSSTFPISAGAPPEHQVHGFEHVFAQQQPQAQANAGYHPESAYVQQAMPMHYNPELDLGTPIPGEEQMLAAMQAIKNPAFWNDVLMPGFTWPESDSSAGYSPESSGRSAGSPSPYQNYQALPPHDMGRQFLEAPYVR